jgi:chromosome segregation ATPase
MYIALGLLSAGLLVLIVTPAIWHRAQRLTRARIESAVPMTRAEIQAEKDQLRADFAMSTRRLEMSLDRFKGQVANQTVEIDRRRAETAELARGQAERAAAIKALEERLDGLARSLAATDERLAGARQELAAREVDLRERAERLATVQGDLAASEQLGEEQQLELVARNTEIGNLTDQLAGARAAEASVAALRDEIAAGLSAERARYAAERRRADDLAARLAGLEAERIDRLAELERRAAEVEALKSEIASGQQRRDALAADIARLEIERAEQRAALGHQAEDVARLRAEIAAAASWRGELEARLAAGDSALRDAKGEIATLTLAIEAGAVVAGDNLHKAIAATEAEKQALAARVLALETDHVALLTENAELRRVAGAEWETERLENQRLRERLNQIAMDVVHMAQAAAVPANGPQLVEDGNGSETPARRFAPPFQRLPAQPPIARTPPRPPIEVAVPGASEVVTKPAEKRTLADRLRALQQTAARY